MNYLDKLIQLRSSLIADISLAYHRSGAGNNRMNTTIKLSGSHKVTLQDGTWELDRFCVIADGPRTTLSIGLRGIGDNKDIGTNMDETEAPLESLAFILDQMTYNRATIVTENLLLSSTEPWLSPISLSSLNKDVEDFETNEFLFQLAKNSHMMYSETNDFKKILAAPFLAELLKVISGLFKYTYVHEVGVYSLYEVVSVAAYWYASQGEPWGKVQLFFKVMRNSISFVSDQKESKWPTHVDFVNSVVAYLKEKENEGKEDKDL